MGKCIITTLNSVCSGDLLKLGELRVKSEALLNTTAACELFTRAVSGSMEIETPSEYPMTDQEHAAFGGYNIGIMNKYNLKILILGYNLSVNLGDLAYCSGLNQIELKVNTNDYSDGNRSIGTTEDLGKLSSLAIFASTLNPRLTGDIKFLGNCLNLSQFSVGGSGVTGDMLGLVAISASKGRDTGSVEINHIATGAIKGKIVFNGLYPTQEVTGQLTWEKSGNNYLARYVAGNFDESATISVNQDGSYTVIS